GINAFLGALDRAKGDPEFIQARHEEMAAFMACGHAKFTGEVGVCMATSGPGAIHLLNGLYDGKLDHQPVVAIIGQQKRMSLGANYQQEVDLNTLYKDVASEYVMTIMAPTQARHVVDRAVRIAKDSRQPTAIIIPEDVQEAEYSDPPRAHGSVYSSIGYSKPVIRPRDEDLKQAARILNEGQKVALLIGQGAAEAADEVVQVAELLSAGVAKALNGRAVLPDDLPFVTGAIGLLGTKPSYDMMMGCDTLLMIGTSFPYAEWLPEEGSCRAVQIDIDGRLLGMRYAPTECNLVGDSKDTLQALIPLLKRKADRAWQENLEQEVERWWKLMDNRAHLDAQPINPQLVFAELSPRLPDNCILTSDSGSATNWWARHLRLRKGMKTALSGTLATMCPAVPYALGAKFAYPDRPVIACLGDGAMQMLGNAALVDLVHYQDRWPNKQCIVLVLHNDDLNQVTWEQRVLSGDPKLNASQVLPDFPFAKYAETLGIKGIRVERPEDVAPAWEEALSHQGLVLYEAITDPEVPPLPPHIKFEQAKKMAMALPGDPHAGRIVKQAFKGKVEEFITR
ncbi:MAG TPA: thiamine pyrophosphate-requiring protein, partial [Solirubrobacteraceae bacterium]|nr:thiamine pyrophosphate-requiring protein [Solirubrobacteraceae bacterium]